MEIKNYFWKQPTPTCQLFTLETWNVDFAFLDAKFYALPISPEWPQQFVQGLLLSERHPPWVMIKLSDEKHSHTRRDDDNLEPETMLNLQMTLKFLLRMGLHVVCLQKNGFKDKKLIFEA